MVKPDLQTILQTMLTDIADPECHYWLYSNYFDIQQPTDRTTTQWYMCPLFVDYDSVWNAAFEDEAVLVDVILKNKLPAERERIKIEFSQIYAVKRVHFDEEPKTEAESLLYSDYKKMQMPPVH